MVRHRLRWHKDSKCLGTWHDRTSKMYEVKANRTSKKNRWFCNYCEKFQHCSLNNWWNTERICKDTENSNNTYWTKLATLTFVEHSTGQQNTHSCLVYTERIPRDHIASHKTSHDECRRIKLVQCRLFFLTMVELGEKSITSISGKFQNIWKPNISILLNNLRAKAEVKRRSIVNWKKMNAQLCKIYGKQVKHYLEECL